MRNSRQYFAQQEHNQNGNAKTQESRACYQEDAFKIDYHVESPFW